MTSPTRRPSLEEVLDKFFFSAEQPSPALVLRVCEAHPEYREDILEFAALWSSYEASPEATSSLAADVSEESVSRLQSFVLNRIHEVDGRSSQPSDIDAVKNAVSRLVGGKLARAATAAGLGGSALLLSKVLTTITDVPAKVIRDLAQHLHVAPMDLRQCLGPQLAGPRSYSSVRAPIAPALETWESAVRSLSVSEDEKKRLLAFQSEEQSS